MKEALYYSFDKRTKEHSRPIYYEGHWVTFRLILLSQRLSSLLLSWGFYLEDRYTTRIKRRMNNTKER